jgi:hypothetical protein
MARRGDVFRGARRLLALLVVVLSLSACGVAAPAGSIALPPRTTPTPEPTVTNAVAQTRLQIAAALAAAGFQLSVPTVPFRPPESARLAAAPRAVFQVVLPNDPTHGYIVVYEFPDAATANIAGQEMASYLGAGPGKVQFTPDTMHALRQLGTTLIFYSWSPANSPGPDAATIGQVLTSVGQGFDIPR